MLNQYPYFEKDPIKNFHFHLENQAQENPFGTAFIYLEDGENEEDSINYGELDRRSRTSSGFFQQSFKVDDRLILLLPNDLTFISNVIGCMYAGIIPIPMHPINNQQTLDKCKHVIKDSGTSYVLSTRKIYNSLQRKYPVDIENWNWIFIEDISDDNLNFHKRQEFPEEKVAFLQYTSGSTSHPKGVRVTHKSLLNNIANLQKSQSITKDDIILSWLPFFHDMGIIAMIFQSIFVGIKCILFPPMSFVQNPMRWVRAISKYRATVSGAPNFAYSLCADRISSKSEPLDLSCWEQAFCGAEPVKVDTFHKFRDEFELYGFKAGSFYPGYGMAESTLVISGGERGEVPRIIYADSEELKQNKIIERESGTSIISCGKSISEHEIRIVDPKSYKECPDNEVGEIWFSGDSVADGYWNKNSDDVFKAKIAGGDDRNYLRTGDLGFVNRKELFVTGRLKELIIMNGQNYFPKDIEELVESKEFRIRENCTAAFEFQNGDSKQLAFIAEIRREEINRVDFKEVANAIRRILSEDMGLNVGFVGMLSTGRMPKTTSGKIQRKLYEQLIHKNELKFVYEWRNEFENAVKSKSNTNAKNIEEFKEWLGVQISKALKVDTKTIQNDVVLNQYGMDSMSAVGLSGQIEEYLKQPISPTIFYNYPTVNAVAEYLLKDDTKTNDASVESPLSDDSGINDIAIIGMGIDLPNGQNIDQFWENLCEGKNSISPLSDSRLELHDQCRDAGFINDVDGFDAHFFNISRKEAEQMDPQQRLLLQTSYHAIENANIDVNTLGGSKTGVFIGIGNSDYNRRLSADKSQLSGYTGLGNAFSIAANRLSYLYDLKGPSLAVDTACSSSLVATHLGINSLLRRESDMALIGGVNLILDDSLDTVFSEAGMLSKDFQCKTFDASANGYVRGEGCGVILVKRMVDALRDGNTVHAVIKGSAINQDGITNGITAPNGISQKDVITKAVENAGIQINDLDYIETHGTGTPLGDPIEVNALAEVLKTNERPCYLGAIKSNIGHLEFAAGIAGLIKTALCLKHKKIPGNSNFENLNPLIKIDQEKIKIPKTLTDWITDDRIRRAGVSSFGFGGTNAHVILEEAPILENEKNVLPQESNRILALSAKSNKALLELIERYKKQILTSDATLEKICYTANTARGTFSKRYAICAATKEDLLKQLDHPFESNQLFFEKPKTAFLFTGQGSQYSQMGKAFYNAYPSFKLEIDFCASWLKENYSYDLLDIIFNAEKENELIQTQHSQVAIFVLEYALAKFMMSVGVVPKTLLGHSIGEFAAACIANVFSLEDALMLVYHRGKFMQALPDNGVMYSVISDFRSLQDTLAKEPSVQIAAFNSPKQVVLSGEKEAVEKIIQELLEEGIYSIQLKVSHAFHSVLMKPASELFYKIAQKVSFNAPTLPIVSSVTGKVIQNEMSTPKYWRQQIVESVKFDQGVESLKELGTEIYFEIGPSPILTSLLKQADLDADVLVLPSFIKTVGQTDDINDALSALFIAGHTIDWKTLYPGNNRSISLPLYPFQKEKYWIETKKSFIDTNESIESLIQQLESVAEFSNEEKALLPKVLESLQSLSNKSKNRSKELLYRPDWVLSSPLKQESTQIENEHCLLIENNADPLLSDALRSRNPNVKTVSFSSFLDLDNVVQGYNNLQDQIQEHEIDSNVPLRIILAFGKNEGVDFERWNQEILIGLSSLALLLKANSKTTCWIVTQDAVVNQQGTDVANSALWGAAKAMSLDYSQSFKGIINYCNSNIETLYGLVQDVFFEDKEQYINYVDNEKYVYRIRKEDAFSDSKESIKCTGNYIISGGLGSLGLHVAEWLSKKGANKLILLTRKSEVDSKTREIISERISAGTEVLIETCDVSSRESVVELSRRLDEKSIAVNGIIHAAGSVGEYLPEEVTKTVIHEIVDTKITGAVNLYENFKKHELEFTINFSSIAAIWGSTNQMLYATANHYLDAYTSELRESDVKAYSINWGPWAESKMINTAFKSKLRQNGIELLNPSDALKALEQIIQNDRAQSIVVDVDWDRFSDVYSLNRTSLILSELVEGEETEDALKKRNKIFIDEIKNLHLSSEINTHLTEVLQKMTTSILGNSSGELPEINKGFFEQGFDSIMALDFKNKIQNKLGIILPNTLLFEQPNIYLLSIYLTNLLQGEIAIEVPEVQDDPLDEVFDDMSESELALLLAEELKNT